MVLEQVRQTLCMGVCQFDTLTQGFYVNGQMKLFLVEKDQRAKCSLVFSFIVQIFSSEDLQMRRM